MKHRISHYPEYFLMLSVQTVIRLLPLSYVVKGAMLLASVITYFFKIRNSVVMSNLNTAFPEMSVPEKEKIRDRMYRHILASSFESYKYMYLSKKEKLEHLLMDNDSVKLLDDISDLGKGCIVVGGHFGFFEAGGHFAVCHGIKAAYVVANQKNKLTEELIDIPREKAGFLVIHRKHMMKLFRALKDNYFVALLSDQNAGRKHGVFVDFFGKKASTHRNPAVISLKYDIPMLLVNTVRDEKEPIKHRLSFRRVEFGDISKSDAPDDDKVLKLVQRYTSMLEEQIRKDPDHYWWIHKRYKTRPEDEIQKRP